MDRHARRWIAPLRAFVQRFRGGPLSPRSVTLAQILLAESVLP